MSRDQFGRLLFCLAALPCAGCSPSSDINSDAAQVLVFVDIIDLTETADAVSVFPAVRRDPAGGFLVSDGREGQIRRYDARGTLLWHAGKKGDGPGEFERPTAVARLPSGMLIASDYNNRLTLFDSAGHWVVRTIETRIRKIEDIEPLSDSLLLVTGVLDADPESPRIHIVDVSTGSVRSSFFEPFGRVTNKVAANTIDWTKIAVRGDTVVAIFALLDTLYVHTVDGRLVRSLPLQSARFRLPPAETPPRMVGPQTFQWLATFDQLSDVYALRNGGYIVQYQNMKPDQRLTRQWHLLRVRADGSTLTELSDVPRLLWVSAAGDTLPFQSPDAERPSQWLLGVWQAGAR